MVPPRELYWVASLLIAFSLGRAIGATTGPATTAESNPKLTLTIACSVHAISAGDEIPITFTIRNDGDSPYTYFDRNYDRSGRMDEYALAATDSRGVAVPDPRAALDGPFFGGGLGNDRILAPGESFSKTILLNDWALVTKPGTYHVMGTYGGSFPEGSSNLQPSHIDITVLPRTHEEMGAYIDALSTELKSRLQERTTTAPARVDADGVIAKLIYTCDPRIVPTVIEAMYAAREGDFDEHFGYWAQQAFLCYLPRDPRNIDALTSAAGKRGMAEGMGWILRKLGCPTAKLRRLIAISLSLDHPDAWGEGAMAAQQICDDSFTQRLIFLALHQKDITRDRAIYALAMNRTDESVAVLKQLLGDEGSASPGEQSPTARKAAQAIRTAYCFRGDCDGRKLRPDDFDKKYQRPQ